MVNGFGSIRLGVGSNGFDVMQVRRRLQTYATACRDLDGRSLDVIPVDAVPMGNGKAAAPSDARHLSHAQAPGGSIGTEGTLLPSSPPPALCRWSAD